eukprot:CAMPEP_0177703228 /NCGR_PEP_ID=MMETSP0484_2-20121128/7560_1 /TAXON_ID=354590 /ORGANISM="Rhodomonas lens, Strain RHODO" /LENGTH=1172 /DNA_ID=CAMNT_0019214569 /DNA_START=254 /DNA_END=3772 /DNA_ORIENTATION=-
MAKQRVRSCATCEKKASMKTADDVIKRVLWDDDVPSSEIAVGYEDRFLGVMQKPFSAFNWCDFGSLSDRETAIPQHRIVYFKYRDVIVWDKRTRLDNIFGSVGGETIDHVVEHYDTRYAPQVQEEPIPAADEERGNEEQICNDDRPNYFVALRITDANLVAALRQVQCRVLEADPRLHAALLPSNKFHITLTTLRLDSDEEKQAAREVMAEAQTLLARVLPASSAARVQGIGCFRDRVLHAQLAPACQTVLASAVAQLSGLFAARGLKLAGMHRPFTAHITLAKLSRQLSREVGAIDARAYAGFGPETELGWQAPEGLELCEMGAQSGPDGFYVRLCPTVRNSAPEPFVAASNAKLHALVAPHTAKRVVIMRGLPGSGKSSLAWQLAQSAGEGRAEVCSADAFFEREEGGYQFSADGLAAAHAACWARFHGLAARHTPVIIVDNTHASQPEVQRYVDGAAEHGYSISVVETVCTGTADVAAFQQRGRHRVPMASMLGMLARWVPCHGAWLVDTRPPPLAPSSPFPAPPARAAEEDEEESAVEASAREEGRVWQEGEGVRELLIFDMDGTLLLTPGKAEGISLWEAAHHAPYPHPSWFDRPESLSLPDAISPGPVLQLWPLCAGRGGARTVVLTGRVEGLRAATERVLAEHLPGARGVDRLVMKPAGSAMKTAEWKVAAVRGLMAECGARLERVAVWDDDARNLTALRAARHSLQRALEAEPDAQPAPQRRVEVRVMDAVAAGLELAAAHTSVSSRSKSLRSSGEEAGPVAAFLGARGLLLSAQAAANGEAAVGMLAGAWRERLVAQRQLSPRVPLRHLARLFGSRRVQRASDVDVCLLAPKSWRAERSTEELALAARALGLTRVYIAHSKRCPRLRVQLPFSNSAPVDVDFVFAPLLAPGSSPLLADAEAQAAFEPRALNAVSAVEGTDGVAFAEHVARTLGATNVGAEAVGMAVEAGLAVAGAWGRRGSMWLGLRPCHLLELARAALAEAQPPPGPASSSPEDVLRLLVRKAARMSRDEWARLTNGFVPAYWVAQLPALWARVAEELLGEAGEVTAGGLERAVRRGAVRRGAEWSVRVRVEAKTEEARWRGMLQLQAKLPLAFHAALVDGAELRAGPCTDCEVWMLCGGGDKDRQSVRARMAWLQEEVMRSNADEAEEVRVDVQITRLSTV